MGGILTGKGVNAQRRLASGRTSYDAEVADLSTTSTPPSWYRAVVEDVIYDPAAISDDRKTSLAQRLLNPELLSRVPRNSIIARLVSNAASRRGDDPAIFFPMLSHIGLPLKPGEHVWVMFEDADRSTAQGFWLSRIVELVDVDDPNFTHADRKFDDRTELTSVEKALRDQGLEADDSKPGFPNGGNSEASFTMSDPDGYRKIEEGAVANRVFTREPVPRYTKRPADMSIMGSNNTLIVFGEDRTGAASQGQDDQAKKPTSDRNADGKDGKSGTIDIVVGRGRELPDSGRGQLTAPSVVENIRGFRETDKEVSSANPAEGDPDFLKDAARVYVTMDTRGDTNFSTGPDDMPELAKGKKVEGVDEGAFIIAKGDHIRIIARQDDAAKPKAINGTIRIIKEGIADDEGGKGRAIITIEKDGTIMIDGPRIIIGSGIEKANGKGRQVAIGIDSTEPMVLGDTLKQILTEYTNKVNQAIASLGTSVNAFTTLGNFGIAIPDLVALKAAYPAAVQQVIAQATTKFQQDLTLALSKVGTLK